MEFMLLFQEREGTPPPTPEGMAAMGACAQELVRQKKLRRGFPLAGASDAATARVRDARALVTDGPFAEAKEQVAGVWIVEAADRDEALALARRIPHVDRGPVDVHAIAGRYAFRDTEKGKPFLLVFRLEPGFVHETAMGREMIEFGTGLVEDGTQFETAHLADMPPPVRLETRAGKLAVTDGPFAETKEAVGGYSLVRVADRAAAIEIAKRFPHAKWGPVEVREVLFFDRV